MKETLIRSTFPVISSITRSIQRSLRRVSCCKLFKGTHYMYLVQPIILLVLSILSPLISAYSRFRSTTLSIVVVARVIVSIFLITVILFIILLFLFFGFTGTSGGLFLLPLLLLDSLDLFLVHSWNIFLSHKTQLCLNLLPLSLFFVLELLGTLDLSTACTNLSVSH